MEVAVVIWLPLIWWQLHRIANALDRIKPETVEQDAANASGVN
jgi:hypothetical protein